MNWNRVVTLLFCSALLCISAIAEPITNTPKSVVASWKTGYKQRCDEVCRPLAAEHMKLSQASSQNIYVCRVFARTVNTYGTNSSDNCLVFDSTSQGGNKAAKYQCLCVKEKYRRLGRDIE